MKIAIPRHMSIGYNTRFAKSPFLMVRASAMDRDESVTRIEVHSSLPLTLDRPAGFFLLLSAMTLTVVLWPIEIRKLKSEIEIGSFVPAGERIEAANCIIQALEPHSAWNTKGIKETASSA